MKLSHWGDLTSELLDCVAAHLAPNEVTCSMKLMNKAAAKHLKSYVQVKLSQPVPQHAFGWRWGTPDSTRDMTLKQRQHLLALTSRSGVLANLQLALTAAGCTLANDALYESLVFDYAGASGSLEVCQWLLKFVSCNRSHRKIVIRSAAAAGHLHIVRWLLQQERATSGLLLQQGALIAAAGAGQRAVCEGLLPDGAPVPYGAVVAAFANGHVALGEWLREGRILPLDFDNVTMASLYSAVSTLDLPSFQRLFAFVFGISRFSPDRGLIQRAIFSPTPDWRAKVTWLEQQAGNSVAPGLPLFFDDDFLRDVEMVMKDGPVALERVQLLRERGMLGERAFAGALLLTAARARNLPVLEYLVDNAINTALVSAMTRAVHDGNLDLLRELKARGGRITHELARKAAYEGHLDVLQWMAGPEAGPEGEEALRKEEAWLTDSAAMSGSVEMMLWLRERGRPWDHGNFSSAIRSGSVPLIEMLAAEGCPMQDYYIMRNACFGDLLTLTCLRQLGFPWAPAGETFASAIVHGCIPQQLQRLLDMGCPVNWQRATRVAVQEGSQGVRLWVEAQMQAAGISPTADGACSEGSE